MMHHCSFLCMCYQATHTSMQLSVSCEYVQSYIQLLIFVHIVLIWKTKQPFQGYTYRMHVIGLHVRSTLEHAYKITSSFPLKQKNPGCSVLPNLHKFLHTVHVHEYHTKCLLSADTSNYQVILRLWVVCCTERFWLCGLVDCRSSIIKSLAMLWKHQLMGFNDIHFTFHPQWQKDLGLIKQESIFLLNRFFFYVKPYVAQYRPVYCTVKILYWVFYFE